ncbi:MAG: hypothetical protein Q8L37_06230 [Candidatus Gottesmanbacteria bacterium]|nr:hypothetical protein [Candidatus Gottesmanbacteria bacterium]
MKKKGYAIAVCGSAGGDFSKEISLRAKAVGGSIARLGCTLFTGATTGYTLDAIHGAHQVGGLTVGIAPAESFEDQQKRFEPIDPALYTVIVYTGVGYKMRDVALIRSVDAAIFIGGGVGTLLELAVAIDLRKVIGILDNSGGATELRDKLSHISHRTKPEYIVHKDPKILIQNIIKTLQRRENVK